MKRAVVGVIAKAHLGIQSTTNVQTEVRDLAWDNYREVSLRRQRAVGVVVVAARAMACLLKTY